MPIFLTPERRFGASGVMHVVLLSFVNLLKNIFKISTLSKDMAD